MLVKLFITFFKIGCFSFGGGLAMLPMLQAELTERRKWVSEEELSDYYAVSQCTPGVIAVNTATFVGTKEKGVLGGIVATLGLIMPSMIIIGIIAALLAGYAEVQAVKNAFAGIRA
ncbi:MAG: chromate transporter [Oscillospiraceae bacterium]|nr:chromate transporter [Oscillospiraceae bacterium]